MIQPEHRRASVQALAQFPQFAHLDHEALQRMAERSSVEILPAGRLLFKPGAREHQHLFLLSGEVALVSDQQPVGNVVADTAEAAQELGPERPRQLWGWSKSRVELLCVHTHLAAIPTAKPIAAQATDSRPAAASAPPAPERQPEVPDAALRAARQAQHQAEAEARQLRAQVAQLQQELTQLQQRLRTAEAMPAHPPAPAPTPTPEPAWARVPDRSAEQEIPLSPALDDTAELPSLRLGPEARGVLAPSEIDEAISAWSGDGQGR